MSKIYQEGKYFIYESPTVKQYLFNKKIHRDEGPAIIWGSGKYWYQFGDLHREDGPAIEFTDGRKMWYYKGKEVYCKNNEEFLKIIKLKVFW